MYYCAPAFVCRSLLNYFLSPVLFPKNRDRPIVGYDLVCLLVVLWSTTLSSPSFVSNFVDVSTKAAQSCHAAALFQWAACLNLSNFDMSTASVSVVLPFNIFRKKRALGCHMRSDSNDCQSKVTTLSF
jgi:hypothetical protein